MTARAGDQRSERTKDEWLTPPKLLKALGAFDLDPCSPVNRPWATAKRHFTILDDGLAKEWEGRVWLNPPYGGLGPKWIRRLAEHGNGIAIISARTEANWFQSAAARASGILFLAGRVRFHHVDGTEAKSSPAPSVLIAFAERNAIALQKSGLPGLLFHPPFRQHSKGVTA